MWSEEINKYIDYCLLDEYAKPDCDGIYQLDVDNVPKKDLMDLLELILKADTDFRQNALNMMQNLIEDRLETYYRPYIN